MKILLICHSKDKFDFEIMARWLFSFSDELALVALNEPRANILARIIKEIKRVGLIRFFDVFLFKLYYCLFLSKKDKQWKNKKIFELKKRYQDIDKNIPILYAQSPNSDEAKEFMEKFYPDIIIARCKTLLKKDIFSIAKKGSFAVHPGICPEYRNAHGCFWAFANDDIKNVGVTLLKIDEGVDTGPVYGYYYCKYDEVNDSHIVIQYKAVFDNLENIKNRLIDIYYGSVQSFDVSGRGSAVWGQPQLTRYLRWKKNAKQRCKK